MMRVLLPMVLLLVVLPACARAAAEPAHERTRLLADWEALRFGMFIHFGMGTFTDDEYGRKDSPLSAYHPTALDVDQWIRVAQRAGMKYAVLTTKHCTGHCLWPTKWTDYSVANSPVSTDVVGEFVKACRRHGLKPGFYYLLGWDSHHQPGRTPEEYERFCTGQIEELLTRYGPIAELWLDIPFDMGPDTGGALSRIYARVKELQPDCLVMLNQGFTDGSAVAVMAPTYFYKPTGKPPVPMWPRDLISGEVTLPPPSGHDPWITMGGVKYYIPMEVCDTLARHWFWSADDALNSPATAYRLWRQCMERKANLLLDVAPDTTGRIPDATVRVLLEMKRLIDGAQPAPVNVLMGSRATASNTYRGDAQYGPDKLIDGDSRTRWATDEDRHEAWVQFDLPAARTVSRCYVSEGWNRVRSFAVEVSDGKGGWRPICTGGRIGSGRMLKFRSVTTASIRLHVLKSDGGPTLWDFEVYET